MFDFVKDFSFRSLIRSVAKARWHCETRGVGKGPHRLFPRPAMEKPGARIMRSTFLAFSSNRLSSRSDVRCAPTGPGCRPPTSDRRFVRAIAKPEVARSVGQSKSQRRYAPISVRHYPGMPFTFLRNCVHLRRNTHGDGKVQDGPAFVRQHQKHVEDLEPDRGHDEEIHRYHRFQVIVEERPPGL